MTDPLHWIDGASMARIVFFLAVLLATTDAQAQLYEGRPCRCGEVKNLQSAKVPTTIGFSGYVGDGEQNATSCLYAGKYKGKIVPRTPPEKDEKIEAWEEARERYDHHTCRYGPLAATDKKLETAWCEGSSDDGVGETLGAAIGNTFPKTIALFAGFGKSKKLHRQNNRPKKVLVQVLGARLNPSQNTLFATDFVPLTAIQTTLKDEFGYQVVQLPPTVKKTDYPAFVVLVKILSVYKGKNYRDTCISEIRFND